MDANHLIHSALYTSLQDVLRVSVPDWMRPIIGIIIGSLAIWLTANIRDFFRTISRIINGLMTKYRRRPNQITMSVHMKSGNNPIMRHSQYSSDLITWLMSHYADQFKDIITTPSWIIPINLTNFLIDKEQDIRIDILYSNRDRQDDKELVTYTNIDIRLYSWRQSTKVLRDFLNKCGLEVQVLRNLDPNKSTFMRLDNEGTYNSSNQTYNISLDTVVMPTLDKQRLLTYIERFADKERMRRLSIPDRAFIMLYGHPGTGKTSLIKALAIETKRILVRLTFTKHMTANDFRKMFNHFTEYGYDKVIYVIEEIDTVHDAFLSRTKDDPSNDKLSTILEHITHSNNKRNDDDAKPVISKISITEILEAFDGLCETPGLMMIATTNHLDKLDPAIVRRFGFRLKMGLLCRETFTTIIERHYKRSITDDIWADISETVERMSPNNLIDLCVQNEEYEELITYIRSLDLGDADSLVESEQSSPK